jgi:hypothetical protein
VKQAVINDLENQMGSVVSEEAAQYTLTFEDYSILASQVLSNNAPDLTSRVLSDVYTRPFTSKQLLDVLPQNMGHSCIQEIFKFICRRFQQTDEGVGMHKLANAIISTRDRYIILRELNVNGQLIEDLVELICLHLFQSCF